MKDTKTGYELIDAMTRDERRERSLALAKHHVLYVCANCHEAVWMTKGDGLLDTYRCAAPCFGTMRRTMLYRV